MPVESIPSILLLGLFFGTTLIASRFSVGQYHPTNYVVMRLVIASALFLLVYMFSKKQHLPRLRDLWVKGILTGIFGTAIPMTCVVSAMLYQSSGLTSILLTIGPCVTVVMSHFFLPDEKLSWMKGVGVTIGLSGAVLIGLLGESGLPDASAASPIGYLLVTIAMISGSGTSIYIRRNLQDANTFDLAAIRMFTGVVVVGVFTYFWVGYDLSGMNSFGYLALGFAALVGTFGGMILSIRVVQRFGATASSMTTYVIPVVTAFGGVLILNETITSGMLAGMVLIAVGILIINRKRPAKDPLKVRA